MSKLSNFGFAHGNYSCKCTQCDKDFIGDKRAFVCADCASEAQLNQEKRDLLDEAEKRLLRQFDGMDENQFKVVFNQLKAEID